MKNTIILSLNLIVIISISSFTWYQTNQINTEKIIIIGRWVSIESPKWEREFRSDGKCYDYYENLIEDVYTYKLHEEYSKNKKIKHSILNIENIKNNKDHYRYEINHLDNQNLTLEYVNNGRVILTMFKRKI